MPLDTQKTTIIPSITFEGSKKNSRDIVVVNGQPYYQSTGRNSNWKDMWLPFILIKETDNLAYGKIKSDKLRENLEAQNELYFNGHITKLTADAVDGDLKAPECTRKVAGSYIDHMLGIHSVIKTDIFSGRIATKESFIVSLRLNPMKRKMSFTDDVLRKQYALSEDEIKQINTPFIIRHEGISSSEPYVINQWLVEQGAHLPGVDKDVTISELLGLCAYTEQEKSLFSELSIMKKMAMDLGKNGHIKAHIEAEKLIKNIRLSFYYYRHNIRNQNESQQEKFYNNFKQICVDNIQSIRPELEKYRGWKKVLNNLVLAILGLGIIYAVAIIRNKAKYDEFFISNSYSWFRPKSSKKLDQLERKVNDFVMEKFPIVHNERAKYRELSKTTAATDSQDKEKKSDLVMPNAPSRIIMI